MPDPSTGSARSRPAPAIVKCPQCGAQDWTRERGPDCMYAVCRRCDFGYDIGWGPNPRYFPDEAGMTNDEWWNGGPEAVRVPEGS